MKIVPIAMIAATLSACTASMGGEPMMARSEKDQARLAALTAGKVAGAPMSCLPTYRSRDMIVIDENTVVFRDGQKRVYVNHMQPGCMNLDYGRNALVTHTPTSSLCRGDIAQVLDTLSRTNVGSCVFGDFIPFTRAG
jgi:hypothetical protein